MADALVFFLSLLIFAIAARGLMSAITQNVRLEAIAGEYSLRALKIGKAYKITAWSVLAIFLFGWMTYTFVVAIFEV
jgi:hypothetical protein